MLSSTGEKPELVEGIRVVERVHAKYNACPMLGAIAINSRK